MLFKDCVYTYFHISTGWYHIKILNEWDAAETSMEIKQSDGTTDNGLFWTHGKKQKQKQTNKQWKDMRQRKQEYLTRSSSGEKR